MTSDFRITVGQILKELTLEGLPISKSGFYRMDGAGFFGHLHRTTGHQRIMGREEAERVKKIIWLNYFGEDYVKYRKPVQIQDKPKTIEIEKLLN